MGRKGPNYRVIRQFRVVEGNETRIIELDENERFPFNNHLNAHDEILDENEQQRVPRPRN